MKSFTSSASSHISIRQTFSALQYPNYRLWFFGQLTSLVGTWMQNTAQAYLIYELTKSPAYLGYVGFASGLPSWLFTLYGGVVADRFSRRNLLLVTQTSMMVLAFILAALVFSEVVQPWMIVVLAFMLGVANAFDAPSRVSFVAELVERKDLTNAIALNSTMFNSATVVGPAIAGLAYAAFGPAWCFTINGFSFVAVIIALSLMKLPNAQRQSAAGSAIAQIREGLVFVNQNSAIRTLIINVGILSLCGLSLMTLLPAWSTDILGGDARTYGLLVSGRGIGALVGALMIASLGNMIIRGKLWTAGNLLMPVTLIAFALVRWIPLSLAVIVITGWSYMVQVNTSNALVQTQLEDRLRGRVMSIYTLIFFGGMPLGALITGQLADRFGSVPTLILNAIILAASAGYIWFRLPFIRKLE